MENRSHALLAGLFALFLGAAMVWAVWWLSEDRQASRAYLLVSRGSIGNLNIQAAVRFRGMQAGRVTDIRLDPEDPRNILISISVREDLPLTHGTRAILDSQGVTGIAFIQLDDTGIDPRPLQAENGAVPRLELEASVVSRITQATLEAMRSLDAIARQLLALMDEENKGRLKETLLRLESIANGADRSLAEMPATLAALQELLKAENLARAAAILAHFEEAGSEAAPALSELRALLASLTGLSGRLEDSATEMRQDLHRSGEMLREDTLPRANALLEELAVTAARLGRLLEELERSPQLLLRGHGERPGPGEAGFKANP
jgi:phospholipid/cholesterol/gamma-HCH transport system substrate-binding protein